jgi:hypothetical protein
MHQTLIFLLLLVCYVYAGSGYYRTNGDYKYLTLNIYNYDSDLSVFKNNLRAMNEILCTYNSYKIESVNILENSMYLPFADIIIKENDNINYGDFLNSSYNLNNLKYHVIIKNINDIDMYYKLSQYLMINKYNIIKRCTRTNTICNNTCIGENNICSVSYPVNLIEKSISSCFRVDNIINYRNINSSNINLRLYRHTNNTLYQNMINIMRNIESINRDENYITNIDIFPPPIFNSFDTCNIETRPVRLGFFGNPMDPTMDNCYPFIYETTGNIGEFVNRDDFAKYKTDNPIVKHSYFLRTGEYIRGDFVIKFNDLIVPDNYIYERTNDFKIFSPNNRRGCFYTTHYIIENTDIGGEMGGDNAWCCDVRYSTKCTNYYMLCSRNDVFTMKASYCYTTTVEQQLSEYNNIKIRDPERYGSQYPSNFNDDVILRTLEESNFGVSIVLIITNEMKVFDENIDNYIRLSNRKLLSINIFIYQSNLLPVSLKKFIDNTNTIINIIKDDPFDYMRYISFITNKQIISYKSVPRIYNFNINLNEPKKYQLISPSNFNLYDEYGNQRNTIKTIYTDNLFKFDFTLLPGRNIFIFNNNDNKFAILKNYIIDDGMIYIDNNTIYINTNKEIIFNYSIYSNNTENSYHIKVPSINHQINLNSTNIFQTFVIDIDWELINMNMFENIYHYTNNDNNIINPPGISGILKSFTFVNDELKVSKIFNDAQYFKKLTICDLRYFSYCIAFIIWLIVFIISIFVIIFIMYFNLFIFKNKDTKCSTIVILIILWFIIFALMIYFCFAVHFSIPHKGFTDDNLIVAFVIFIPPIIMIFVSICCSCMDPKEKPTC